ncbi:MAG: phenol hydroxylase subunit [Steroidobacteraceae bacterium]
MNTNSTAKAFDATQKYVRVCAERENGFVEFEFSIGDPALCVELMLPRAAFTDFCRDNQVVLLPPRQADGTDWVARLNESSRRESGDA